MSAQPYEPLHAVPSLTPDHVRMAWLLKIRTTARRALDAVLAAPRKAAAFLSRGVHRLHLDTACAWLRRVAARLARPLQVTAARLGTAGVVASSMGLVTSPTGRAVLDRAGRAARTALGWTARTAYSGLDRVLRCFGSTGNAAADKLFASVVAVGGKVAAVASPVVHRVARLSDPRTTQARVLSGLCQSYVVHRLLKGFVANPWVRIGVEVLLIPAVLDSRVWAWLKGTLGEARARAQRLQEQARVLVDLERQQPQSEQLLLIAAEPDEAPTDLVEEPVPSNRAERRAAQRSKRPQQ